MPKVEFRHSVPLQVRFNDLDVLGHVTNAVYQVYYSQAGVNYYEKVLKEQSSTSFINFVMATITIDYLKSIMFDSQIAVQIRVAGMGHKSFEFAAQIIDLNNGDVYSRCRSREVCYDRSRHCTIEIPQAWRQTILEYEYTPPLTG